MPGHGPYPLAQGSRVPPVSKAKAEPNFRFYLLNDKIYRGETLDHASALAKANQGAPGVDEQTFEQIEPRGAAEWLDGIGKELRAMCGSTVFVYKCYGSR